MDRCQIKFKHEGVTNLLVKGLIGRTINIYAVHNNIKVECKLIINGLFIINQKESKYAFNGLMHINTGENWNVEGEIEPRKGVLNSKKELMFLLFRNVTS